MAVAAAVAAGVGVAARLWPLVGAHRTVPPPLSLPALVERELGSVVSVEAVAADGSDQGSGFIYDRRGDILTNAHVVAGAEQVWVRTAQGQRYAAQVIGEDPTRDVAALRVAALSHVPPLALADSQTVALGDAVVAFGSPLGLKNTVTEGNISGLDRNFAIAPAVYRGVFQISAPIAPGNSGGPLVLAANGEVVGIETAAVVNVGGNIGFAIPIDQVKALAEAWAAHPEPPPSPAQALATASQNLVRQFYQDLNRRQYAQAWSLLGSAWRTSTPLSVFAAGYANTVQDQVSAVKAVHVSAQSAVVTANLVAKARVAGGALAVTRYRLRYQVGWEGGHLAILSGQGTVIPGP
ncbi:MAG: S1C family serine protease [Firmicutes bacterium]|nr:trypsin-like peptidase domain-containing protein [Alicyclobacillaceae bacterium]MCL6498053.1 S1C family serine protease [Bacillota bacterium]